MVGLADYEGFAAIVDEGSLTAASKRLGRSLQAVSRSLAAVEADLGTSLIRRTTRRLQPTPAGLAFHGRVRVVLSELAAAREDAKGSAAQLDGRLRIGAPTLFAPVHLVPLAETFLRRHPGLTLELVLSDAFDDLVTSGLDLAIRIGRLPDSGLKARRLGGLRRVAFASPDYLARHGRPERPLDLADHASVVRTLARSPRRWDFRVDGRTVEVDVDGRFAATSAAACNEAVASGLGIGIAPLWQVAWMVEAGRVELILVEHEPEPTPIHAVWLAGPPLPARVRAFLSLCASRLVF